MTFELAQGLRERARMRRALLLCLVLAGGCSTKKPTEGARPTPSVEPDSGTGGEVPVPANPLAEKIDGLFASATTDGTFAGSVVVIDGGKTVLTRSYGEADRAAKTPNASDTIFRIGSLSKQFTASAILALASDGKLAVSDPVSKHFPEYPKASLEKEGVEVTLHHLLSHISGLPDGRKTSYFEENVWKHPLNPAALIAATKDLPLVRTPGTKFEYLNYGYFLLGLVVERVSGVGYERFLRERFFTPLGMTDTGTLLPAEKRARAALGYHRTFMGTFVTMANDPEFGDRDVTFAFGSGQVYSTTTDLARWDRALAEGKIVGREQLFAPNLDGYGYGWSIEQTDGVEYVWHNGALSPLGFSTFLVRVPSKDRMVAYLSNVDIAVTQKLEAKVAKISLE